MDQQTRTRPLDRREFLASLAVGSVALASAPAPLHALTPKPPKRPNILWITIEDTSAYEFGCYGNEHVKTPNIDALAARGIQYMNAWSTGPQCSPVRSSIITGSYATTYGMDIHRHRWPTPDDMLMFPQILRNEGYFCTNNSKTDYNTTTNHKACWDECGNDASYNSPRRKPDQPFFAVFNSSVTHMGRLRSFTLDERRDFAAEGLDPAKLTLPEYVPDLPAVRSDYAFHLEGVCDIDKWVRIFLDDLEKQSLVDDTIIFFYSDHGGCLPRGKGYLFETGLRVPLVVCVPPKWQSRAGQAPGRCDRLVGFVDLGPTVLSLARIQPDVHMQGQAFLGDHQAAPRTFQFGLRANQAAHYVPLRAVTDGRWKYIRNYLPHKPLALRNFYQWGMPADLAWDEYVLSGRCERQAWLQPYRPQPAEMLFDLANDPWELNNLADAPEHADHLHNLRNALSDHIRQTGDLGFFPRSTRPEDAPLYAKAHAPDFPLAEILDAAELAGLGDPKNAPRLTQWLQHDQPALRFWAAAGFATLASRHPDLTCPHVLAPLVEDADPAVAATAAEALCYFGQTPHALDALLQQFANGSDDAYSSLETLTWYPKQATQLKQHAQRLKQMAQNGANAVKQPARSLLVNLGELPISQLYTHKEINAGLKVNQNRRPLQPTP